MSTHCVSMMKNFNLSVMIKEEEAISMEKQGILSILDNVDSSSSSSSDGEEDHHEQLIKDQPIKTFDSWSSILSSKNEESSNKLISTSPYVHPLVKRSTSCLTEKSLEICTESLGSETGSDSGFACFPSSPTSKHKDSDDDKDDHHRYHQQQQQYSAISKSYEDFRVYNYNKRLISSCRSFPPSLPSVHMQSHRQNGRLILETASVPHKNNLYAQRLDGHLLLTFINRNDSELEMENRNDEVEVLEQVFDGIQEVEDNEIPHSDSGGSDEEEFEEDEGDVMEQSSRLSSEVMNVNRAALMTLDKKNVMGQSSRLSSEVMNVNRAALMMLDKKNQPTWSKYTFSFCITPDYFDPTNSRFNNSINILMTEEEKDTSNFREYCYTYPSMVSPSLPPPLEVAEVILAPPPPPPPPAATTSLKAYEYYWRKKPTVANIVNNCTINKYYYNNKQVGVAALANGTDTEATSTTKIAACTQDLVLIRGNKASTVNNNLVPLLRSCKEPRRSLIIWEPYCIATS